MAARNRRFEKILFPTDFSESSSVAAEYARDLARLYKARLYVLHVVDISYEAAGFYIPHLSFEKLNKELRESAKEMLQKFVSKHFKGFKKIETHVLVGEPYVEILKVIKGSKIDLAILGPYGKTGIDRVLFGSTTEKVMKKATCPVLVVPPNQAS